MDMKDTGRKTSLTDLYIKDRHSGLIHKIGTNRHDSLSVTDEGTVTYENLQNGDGCIGYASKLADKDTFGYEFVTSESGMPESGTPCPSCGSYMLQPLDKYFFCVDCGTWSDKDGNIIPEQKLLDEGLIVETRAETEKRLNAILNPPKTNFRRITSSPEALAEFIENHCNCINCIQDCPATKTCDDYKSCYRAMVEWLKQESEEQ